MIWHDGSVQQSPESEVLRSLGYAPFMKPLFENVAVGLNWDICSKHLGGIGPI